MNNHVSRFSQMKSNPAGGISGGDTSKAGPVGGISDGDTSTAYMRPPVGYMHPFQVSHSGTKCFEARI